MAASDRGCSNEGLVAIREDIHEATRALYQPAETLLRRARRQYPIGPPYVFAMDVPVGMSQGLRQASPYGLAARDGLAATVATCRPGGTHGPAMPDSRHKLRNAGQVFATAKPKTLRRNTPEAGVR